MVQINGKITALVAGIGIASGVGGTRAFDALTAPTTDRFAPISEREQRVVAALGSATKALDASVDLNFTFSDQKFAARLRPEIIAKARAEGINITQPSDEDIHAVIKRCDEANSKFREEFERLKLQYTPDQWSALFNGSRS
jgi:hypothetical protein